MCCSRRGMPRASIVCAINDIEGRSYVILVNGWMLSVSVAAAHAACSSKPLNDSNVVERGAVGPRFGGAAVSLPRARFQYISLVPSIAPILQAGARYATHGDKAGGVMPTENADRRWHKQTAASV